MLEVHHLDRILFGIRRPENFETYNGRFWYLCFFYNRGMEFSGNLEFFTYLNEWKGIGHTILDMVPESGMLPEETIEGVAQQISSLIR